MNGYGSLILGAMSMSTYGCKDVIHGSGACAVNTENKKGINMKSLICTSLITLALLLSLSGITPVNAFTVITVSTGTAPTIEKELLAQATTQFNASLVVNPLASNTYTLKLFGRNPNYTAPPAVVTLDQVTAKLVAISSNTSELLYAEGMVYERKNDAGMIGAFMNLCGNATNYAVTPGGIPATWDPATCHQVLGFMDNWIMIQSSGIAVTPDPLEGF